MGCNYYAVSREPKVNRCQYHIGKSSVGWKFLFHGYSDDWDDMHIRTYDDWEKWLRANDKDFIILDEYNRTLTVDGFLLMVQSKQGTANPENFKHSENRGGYRFSFTDFC